VDSEDYEDGPLHFEAAVGEISRKGSQNSNFQEKSTNEDGLSKLIVNQFLF